MTSTSTDAERQEALARLTRAHGALKLAQKAYDNALVECGRMGIANTKIARTVGITEVAVRNWLKRRGVISPNARIDRG